MGAKMSLEVSDGLAELSKLLADYEHEPRVMQPDDASTLRACLKVLRNAARRLENEVSQKRWNAEAKHDRIVETEVILSEVTRPGTNVLLFPIIPRPFSDGHPGAA